MTKALYILPVQTDRGVMLRITYDGKELDPVGPLNDEYGMFIPLEAGEHELPPAMFDDVKKKSTANRQRKRSIRQENLLAKDVGGRRQYASGALPGFKGDFFVEGKIRGEAKYTAASSYRLELSTMQKVGAETKPGEMPVVVVEFTDKASGTTLEKLAVVYYSDWKRMVNGDADGDDQGLPRRKRAPATRSTKARPKP